MTGDFSFDFVSQVNLQEVDNAVNQATKEMHTRFDFKGSKSLLTFNRNELKVHILADDDMKLKSVTQMFQEKASKRGISIKAFKYHEPEKALDGMIRQMVEIVQGVPQEKAKEIVKLIKELKLKAQPSIQGDQIRVSSRSKDELQTVIQAVRARDFGIPLQFINYRG